jgi:PAS domain S-box-containing protein
MRDYGHHIVVSIERSVPVERSAIRLLLVEDSEDDAEVILNTLRRAGFALNWRRVDSAGGVRQALTDSSWDAVIADYSMPGFSGMDALKLVKAIRPGVPFILASAVIGEERAVEAMRAGACDYVMKRNLTRLPLALGRELGEAEERRERRRAEEALRRQTGFIATLASSLGDGIVAVDAEGRITFVNAAAERIIGWRADDLTGRDLHSTVHVGHPAGEKCPVTRVLSSGQSCHADDDLFRCKDGSVLPVSFTISPLHDGHDGIGAVLVFQDIRQRKRAEHADHFLSRASALLSESLDLDQTVARIAAISAPELADFCAVSVVEGEDGLMRQASANADGALSPLRRWQPDAPSWPWVAQVIQTDSPVIVHDAPPELFSSAAWTPEESGALQRIGPAAYLCVPMRTGTTVVGALCLLTAKARRTLDPSDVELAQRLANRAAMAIAHARLYHEAQEAVRARDDFLSIASHELRTPLTPLQLHMMRLRTSARERKLGSMAPEELTKVLETAVRLVERLSLEVSNLLDVSRIVCGRVTVEPEQFDLVTLVRDVADRAQMELERAKCGLELETAGPVVGRWDRLRVERIVSNLLSNAMKYGAGKRIEIAVDVEGDDARLIVRDHGIGIARDQIERIFGRFERAVSAHTYGGLGLGLYIVRQFAEAHGGHVEVQTAEGLGSTFTVRLPLQREESCVE